MFLDVYKKFHPFEKGFGSSAALIEDWLKKKEAEAGSEWEKDDKAPGKKNVHVEDAQIIVEEKKPAPAPKEEETPPPDNSDAGDLSSLGANHNGKELL